MNGPFEFVIVGTGLDPQADAFEDRLINAGCDDATIAVHRGLVLLEFARRASTMEVALMSAVADVERGGLTIRGVEPSDLVSLADISRRTNMTRAAISNYVAGVRSSGFPLPIEKVTTDNPLWSWAEVAQWLYERERIEASTFDAARLIAAINARLITEPDFFQQERLDAAQLDIQRAA